MALALVLLAGAGAFVRSFQNAAHMDLGFDKERLLGAARNSAHDGEPLIYLPASTLPASSVWVLTSVVDRPRTS